MENELRNYSRALFAVLLFFVTFVVWNSYVVARADDDELNTEVLIRELMEERTEHEYEISFYKAKINDLSAELAKVCYENRFCVDLVGSRALIKERHV